jgi:hypothetical protein
LIYDIRSPLIYIDENTWWQQRLDHDAADASRDFDAIQQRQSGQGVLAPGLGWPWDPDRYRFDPILLAIYALIFGRNTGVGTRAGSPLNECLTIAGLIVMVFTTIWSYRYTRLGKQIADPARRPSEFEIRRVAWIGVAASAVGILFSMLVTLFEVVQLLIYFLRAPQAGVPAIQTTGGWTGELGIRGRRDESVGPDR